MPELERRLYTIFILFFECMKKNPFYATITLKVIENNNKKLLTR